MNSVEIINELAINKTVEQIIHNVAKTDIEDLAQDIYLSLLEKPPELIENLFQKNQLNFFITKMVMNNIRSSTSPYYYTYLKNKEKEISIDEITDT